MPCSQHGHAGYGGRFAGWLRNNDPQPYNSWGNGSAMRVSSIGWFFDTIERTREVAGWSAEVTHNHPEGVKGAEAAAVAIFLARTGADKAEIREYVISNFGYDLSRTCDEIRPGYHHVESCMETVPEAITAFLEGEDFEDAEINGETVSIQPARRCNVCKKDFGTTPILLDKKTGQSEDYRDIVTSVKLSVGGYFGGSADVTIKKNKEGAFVCVQIFRPAESEEELLKNYDHQISKAEWNKLLDKLYGTMYLHEWKKSYDDPDVLDGTQWSLEIKLTGGRKRTYEGSNDYPPYWDALMKVFKEVSGYVKL